MSREHKHKGHPWRDNIEAVTVSIVIIVLFKYFVLEAYKIPSGSMQPTLMGWSDERGGAIFDRVLVDKLAFHYRDPERFEVVVFKYPLDRSKNFIKRIVGMPNEVLEIRHGDLFHGAPGEELAPLRRPTPIQRTHLKRIDRNEDWRIESGPWSTDGDGLRATGPGRAVFPAQGSVRDHYGDGYPEKLAARLNTANKRSGDNEVGDLRVELRAKADASCEELRIELLEATATYLFAFPGPAAAPDARPSIRVTDTRGGREPRTAAATSPWRLAAGASVRIGAQNLDDLLQLEVDGEIVATLEVPAVAEARGARAALSTAGGGAELERVRVWRDLYYTSAGQKVTRWDIPDGHYVMLGDNTQDSADSRDWSLSVYGVTQPDGSEVVVRGNQRSSENPQFAYEEDGSSTVYFYDDLGERWVFPQKRARRLDSQALSFVPRELLRGRAVLVVWPFVPSLDVYRIKWVR